MILDCQQTVPPYASICTLGGLRSSSRSLPNSSLALWTGRMLQPAPVLTLQSIWCIGRVLRLCYPKGSDVFIVSVLHIVEFGGSLEAFYRCFCSVICGIEWSCVLTLGTVLRLFLCVYVFDFSFVTLGVLSAHV